MQKLWERIIKKSKDDSGTVVIEDSVIIPVILFIVAGTMIYCLFLLDMAQIKGRSISLADAKVQEKKTAGEAIRQEELADQLYVAKVTGYQMDENSLMVTIKITLAGSQFWSGLKDYMSTEYGFQSETSAFKDYRKEIMWLKE